MSRRRGGGGGAFLESRGVRLASEPAGRVYLQPDEVLSVAVCIYNINKEISERDFLRACVCA